MTRFLVSLALFHLAAASPLAAQVIVTTSEERKVTRVVFAAGFDRPAEVALSYGAATWRDEYAKLAKVARAEHYRLGSGFWATLHNNVELGFGEKRLPPSVWYLGLYRDAESKWFLTLMDSSKMHRTGRTSGATRDSKWDARVPLAVEKVAGSAPNLRIELTGMARKGEAVAGTLALRWGSFAAMAKFQPAIQKGKPAGEPKFAALDAKRTVTTASGLKYQELRPGAGQGPTADSKVTVNYVAWLTDGTKVDSSFARRQAATFPLKAVIRGWTEGIPKMKPGAVFLFETPPNLAYGSRQTGAIKANSTLIFWVELVKHQ